MSERFRYGLPVHPDEDRTGALLLSPDPRDFEMARIPEVAAVLALGAPPSADLSPYIKGIYNQGSRPSCVSESTCGVKSIQDMLEHSAWTVYDATALYTDNGGTGENGVDTRRVLQDAQDRGLLVLNGTARFRIGSYAFAPRTAGAFEETLKAAVAANRPCVLAMLLPQVFGWESSGAITSGYHQVCVVGYDATNVIILNSWGPNWAKGGFGRVPWAFLTQQNFQNGYVYAYTVIDALDGDLQPPVNKPPIANAGGPYAGMVGRMVQFDGSKSVDSDGQVTSYDWDFGDQSAVISVVAMVGHTYFTPGTYPITLTVTDDKGAKATATTTAVVSEAMPTPGPLSMKVDFTAQSGGAVFSGNVGDSVPLPAGSRLDVAVLLPSGRAATASAIIAGPAPPVNKPPIANPGGPYNSVVGQPVQFDGSGSRDPDGTIVSYRWALGVSDTDSGVRPVRTYTTPGTYMVILTVTDDKGATDIATTYVAVTAPPPPPPVGDLTVAVSIVKLTRTYALYVRVTAPDGKSVAGTVLRPLVGATLLSERTVAGAGQPAIWTIPTGLLSSGVFVTVDAVALDGRKGRGVLVFVPTT